MLVKSGLQVWLKVDHHPAASNFGEYLCDGELKMQHISKEDVSDAQYSLLTSQVRGLYYCKMFGITSL